MKIREYSGPLTVLGAGMLGFSLLCIVSAAALANPRTPGAADIGAQDIVDSAFSNPINTAAALTAVEISEFMPTATPTFILFPTGTASVTPTQRIFVTWTPLPPTRTRQGRPITTATNIPSRTPTRALAPSPTHTQVPTSTFTPRPTGTDTPVPPTNTEVLPTDTRIPTQTDTPEVPTDTPMAVVQSPMPESSAFP